MTTPPRQLLFVCTGNVCRSPIAEYLLRQHLGPHSGWQVRSAGLSAANGLAASAEAIEVLGEKNIDLAPHRSRALTREMIDKADLVVVMTSSQARELGRRFPEAGERVRLLTSFAPGAAGEDIEDPIGGDVGTYRRIRDDIDEALLDLILHLKQSHLKRP